MKYLRCKNVPLRNTNKQVIKDKDFESAYSRTIELNCGEFLVPGKNCIVRLKNKTQYITCKECKQIKRRKYAI